MPRLPNFIIIGAMKCATSTLHEQLARQPGIFMTEPKEPCFFSDDPLYDKGLEWYASLFDDAADSDIRGESSTHYTKLPTWPHTVERMIAHVPDVRCIYVMRDPIDRLISHYIHEWTTGVISVPIDHAVDEHPELIEYSRYARQLEPYLTTIGCGRMLPVFFERLTTNPTEELRRVCNFIGYSGPTPVWSDEAARQNRSDERMRPNALRDFIAYAPVISTIRKKMIPRAVRERVKSLWRMQKRPELSEQKRKEIAAVLDPDLAKLGAQLGIDGLSCASFKKTVRTIEPAWIHPGEESNVST